MSLSSAQLDALNELAKSKSFSRAAKNLALTQSALSQRIAKLEAELGTSLLIREPKGIRFTAAGEKLLRYCQLKASLEAACLADLHDPDSAALKGTIRVGGYSTLMRSVVLPALGPALSRNPQVTIELFTKEMAELTSLLRTGEADFVFMDKASESAGVESLFLGYEEYVLVGPKTKKPPDDLFLDHDQEDQTTFRFLALQRQKNQKVRRSFLDEIYGILDGVALGLGKAVVPLHLAEEDGRVLIARESTPMLVPVYLHYYRQPFYTELQKLALVCLGKVAERLKQKK